MKKKSKIIFQMFNVLFHFGNNLFNFLYVSLIRFKIMFSYLGSRDWLPKYQCFRLSGLLHCSPVSPFRWCFLLAHHCCFLEMLSIFLNFHTTITDLKSWFSEHYFPYHFDFDFELGSHFVDRCFHHCSIFHHGLRLFYQSFCYFDVFVANKVLRIELILLKQHLNLLNTYAFAIYLILSMHFRWHCLLLNLLSFITDISICLYTFMAC